MSLPTANEVTNKFLYGQLTTPTPDALADAVWIRSDTIPIADREMAVDAVEYMQGPGRFALAAMSDLVKKFFAFVGDIPDVISGKEYDKAGIADLLGLTGADYGISFQQYTYDDGNNDYGERVYIWGSTAFKLSDGAKFIVDADGKRHIVKR